MASRAVPLLNEPSCPSAERVPSGKITRFQPASSNSRGVEDEDAVVARRSSGTVPKASAVPVARHQASKK